jgi:hypothetical protein
MLPQPLSHLFIHIKLNPAPLTQGHGRSGSAVLPASAVKMFVSFLTRRKCGKFLHVTSFIAVHLLVTKTILEASPWQSV